MRSLLPTGPNFFFLQYAQELGLHFQWQLADFIQKNRSAIGGLEQARLWSSWRR